MKQTFELRQSQRLAMTPQLQQAVRLLQMSTTELNEEIQLAHETNPLLEFVDDMVTEESEIPQPAFETRAGTALSSEETFDLAAANSVDLSIQENDSESSWPSASENWAVNAGSANRNFDSNPDFDRVVQYADQTVSLKQALTDQAAFLFNSDRESLIAFHIVQNINEAGYLDSSLDEILKQAIDLVDISLNELEFVLAEIQKFEPTGVGARSPEECLSLQMQALDQSRPGFGLADRIVRNHLALLASKDYTSLKKQLGVSESELAEAIGLITELDPHPGYRFSNARIDYTVPDILVEKSKGFWLARINQKNVPRLSINDNYQKLINREKNTDFGGLKEQLQNARWLLSNLEKRQNTILSVAREIVERQQPFFNEGVGKIRPMKLSDIAQPLGIHESTVSRATNGKYLLAPQGILELKYFFSSQVRGSEGQAVSSLAIQTEIKNIILTENAKKPVSDEKICVLLQAQGTQIARRTVAKYREQLNIPSSSKRKSL